MNSSGVSEHARSSARNWETVERCLPSSPMEWFTLVSTAVGVVLGIGATNFNERVKWKRDRRKALYESRSKLYAEYLSGLTKTRDAIRIAARGTYPAGQAL